MTPGVHTSDDRAVQFGRVTAEVLHHLSTSSGLQSWVLVRNDGRAPLTTAALAAVDPTGTVAAPSALPAEPGLDRAHRVQVPIVLGNGLPFGSLVGFAAHTEADLSAAQSTAAAFATALGALATAEMALAADQRAHDLRHGPTDPLTGLATRQGWELRLRRDERVCADFGESAAVVLIELDELKRSNELHGHSAGDEQIRLAGALTREILGGRHFGARITGDRLGVLMVGIGDHEVGELERALRRELSAAQLSTTIGVGHRRPAEGLAAAVAEAEAVLTAAISTREPAQGDPSEAAALLAALENGEIGAYFQPIVDLRTGEAVAVEALARWQSPDGMREPDRFLRAMQEAGLLGLLFDHILDHGLGHLSILRERFPHLRLAVNVEFDAAGETSLLHSISERLQRHDLPADALSIELSERQTFDLSPAIRRDLEAVAAMGVRLMLDDFGTGFASLETLTSLPISGVKLDRKFTGQVIDGDREPVVVKAMVALAAETGLTVIAEGIETQVQCDRLVRMGCRLGQGYLFAPPQPAESVAAVLSAPLVSTF